MKQFLLSFFVAAPLLASLLLLSPRTQTPRGNYADLYSGGMESADARMEWELMRLRDPATGEIPRGIRAKELAFGATLPNDASFNKTDSMTAPWFSLGPANIGGRTRAFAIDATNENILLAGGVSGGLWRSTNGGTDWTRVTPLNFHPGVNGIVQDLRPGHTQTWYLNSGEAYGTSASGGSAFYLGTGIFKSNDGGLNWSLLSATNSGTPQSFDNVFDATWTVAVNNADTVNDQVYVSTIGAIMRSTNGGTSWTKVLGSNTSALGYFTNIQCTSTGALYATISSYDGNGTHNGTSRGIWRSTDGASGTWANISPPFMPGKYRRIVSCVNPQNENQLYFLASGTDSAGKQTFNFLGTPEWNSLWKYTYVSGDGTGAGGIWEDLSVNIPTVGGIFDDFNVQGGYDLVVAVKPDDSSTVFIGGTNLYRSTSAFTDSTSTAMIAGYNPGEPFPNDIILNTYPNQHPDQHVVAFLPSNPDVMFSANDGGIYKTTAVMDSVVNWTTLNNGYLVSQFYTCAMEHNSISDVVVGGLQDNGTWFTNSTSSTSAWSYVAGGDGSYCQIEDGGGSYYFSKQQGVVMKCNVNSLGVVTAWERIDPLGAARDEYGFINPFILNPQDQNIMYLPAGNRLWRNDDLSGIALTNTYDSIATNWTLLSDSLSASLEITAIEGCYNSDRVYIGTNNKFIYRIDNASTSSPTWVNITATAMPPGYVSCLAVDPMDPDRLLAVFSNYSVYSLWLSTDGGTTWSKCAGNLEQQISGAGNGPSLRWAEILPTQNGYVYLVGTSIGLFGTNLLDGTNTVFTQLGTNSIGSAVVDMIDYRITDGKTILATHGYGMWMANITSTGIVGRPSPLNENLLRATVYPNPASEQTTLAFELPQAAPVRITLLDEMGREMEILSQRQFGAGKNEISIPVQRYAAGIYYCVISSGKLQKVISLVIE